MQCDGERKVTRLHSLKRCGDECKYYDLQQKIKYKAEEKGIRVVFIDPSYTSQRCSKCGHIHKDNRNIKVDQAKFKCVMCGFETNADYNAAKNLSIKDIDKIIAAQLSRA